MCIKLFFLILFIFILEIRGQCSFNQCSSLNWEDVGCWSCVRVPQNTDSITINNKNDLEFNDSDISNNNNFKINNSQLSFVNPKLSLKQLEIFKSTLYLNGTLESSTISTFTLDSSQVYFKGILTVELLQLVNSTFLNFEENKLNFQQLKMVQSEMLINNYQYSDVTNSTLELIDSTLTFNNTRLPNDIGLKDSSTAVLVNTRFSKEAKFTMNQDGNQIQIPTGSILPNDFKVFINGNETISTTACQIGSKIELDRITLVSLGGKSKTCRASFSNSVIVNGNIKDFKEITVTNGNLSLESTSSIQILIQNTTHFSSISVLNGTFTLFGKLRITINGAVHGNLTLFKASQGLTGTFSSVAVESIFYKETKSPFEIEYQNDTIILYSSNPKRLNEPKIGTLFVTLLSISMGFVFVFSLSFGLFLFIKRYRDYVFWNITKPEDELRYDRLNTMKKPIIETKPRSNSTYSNYSDSNYNSDNDYTPNGGKETVVKFNLNVGSGSF